MSLRSHMNKMGKRLFSFLTGHCEQQEITDYQLISDNISTHENMNLEHKEIYACIHTYIYTYTHIYIYI